MFFATALEFKAAVPVLIGEFVSSGHGMPHAHHGPIEIALAGMLGALMGFIAGMLVSKIVRFIAYAAGRDGGKGRWAVYGALAGGLGGALWEAFSD